MSTEQALGTLGQHKLSFWIAVGIVGTAMGGGRGCDHRMGPGPEQSHRPYSLVLMAPCGCVQLHVVLCPHPAMWLHLVLLSPMALYGQ